MREHPRRVVGRAVVDDDDLEVAARSARRCCRGFRAEPAAAVVGRDDDRDGRHATRRARVGLTGGRSTIASAATDRGQEERHGSPDARSRSSSPDGCSLLRGRRHRGESSSRARATGISVGVMQVSRNSRVPCARTTRDASGRRTAASAYPFLTGVTLFYLWPLDGLLPLRPREPSRRRSCRARAVNGPFVIAAVGFSGWLSSILVFPVITIVHFGRWEADLASQQVLSPLVNGFLAATTSYLVADWLFRTRVMPHVFPDGRATAVGGTAALGVGARLGVFLVAVAFVPLFTMLGLIIAADRPPAGRLERSDDGHARSSSSPAGARSGSTSRSASCSTALLARTFTRPLAEVTAALRRVRAGTLDQPVRDHVGRRDRRPRGRASTPWRRRSASASASCRRSAASVEPVVRDRLLAGDLRGEGEVRTASILFCDLRDFTTLRRAHRAARARADAEPVLHHHDDLGARPATASSTSSSATVILVVFGLLDDDPSHGPAAGAAGGRALRARHARASSRS